MGKFETIAEDINDAKDLTSPHIKAYIDGLIETKSAEEVDPLVIEGALKTFGMQMNINDANVPITHFSADFFERLENVSCGEFWDKN